MTVSVNVASLAACIVETFNKMLTVTILIFGMHSEIEIRTVSVGPVELGLSLARTVRE